MTLAAIETDERLPENYSALAGDLRGMLDGTIRLFAICGPRGVGKTSLASALANEFCACNRSVMYVPSVLDLFQQIKATFGKGDGAHAALMQRLHTSGLLIIDECHVRDGDKVWQDNTLTSLVCQRYGAFRPTLLISNLSARKAPNQKVEPFQAVMGESIVRRLIEGGGVVEANWGRIQPLLQQSADRQIVIEQQLPSSARSRFDRSGRVSTNPSSKVA